MVSFRNASSNRLLGLMLLVLCATLAWPAGTAYGQARGARPQDAQTAKFQLADAYLRAGQFERAVGLLEDLYRSDPSVFAFYEKLKEAYVSLKRYDDALGLIDARAEAGLTPPLLAERGTLLFQKGDEEAAYAAWDGAVALMPDHPQSYRVVYLAMVDNRLFDRAIEVLEAGRRELRDEAAFRTDLSYLYGLMGAHDQAMQEYVGLIEENPKQLSFVKQRLSRFSEQETMVSQSIVAVERAIRREPLNRALRELAGWLYMEGGDFDKAFDAFRAIDRLESEDGRVLFAFAQNAANAEAFDAALEAYREILNRYPDAPSASSAMLGLAQMYERQGDVLDEQVYDARGNRIPAPHYDAALETYRLFLQTYPGDPRFPSALQRIGQLQQDVFYDLGGAEATLREVTSRYGASEAAALARFNLGQIALQRGDIREARLILARLEAELEIGELAERAQYETARIDFYTGRFESALTIVSALDANTSTDIANDAIALKVLLRENKGPDSLNTPLRLYAQSQLLRRQRRPDRALAVLDSLLAAYPGHMLDDEGRFERASALRDLGRSEEALTSFRDLAATHPDSYLADRSLFTAAEIYERELDNPAEALDAYSNLLVAYPGSLLAPEIRARIRRLRGDGV